MQGMIAAGKNTQGDSVVRGIAEESGKLEVELAEVVELCEKIEMGSGEPWPPANFDREEIDFEMLSCFLIARPSGES